MQGLLHMGKGLMTLSLQYSDRLLSSPAALAGILAVLHACLDFKGTLLGKFHYLLYLLAPAMQPRMLVTLDKYVVLSCIFCRQVTECCAFRDMKPLPVSVRVGQAVDVVGQAGRPKTITGFATHTTPVLLAYEQVWIFELHCHLLTLNRSITESWACNGSIYSAHLHSGRICYIEGESKLQTWSLEDAEKGSIFLLKTKFDRFFDPCGK